MLKNIAVIPLLIAFAAQTFSGACIQLGYIINPDAFAKNCINKDRPKMHCNGKCQMMKKMKEEEKKEQENTENKLDYKVTVHASESFFYVLVFTEISTSKPAPFESVNPAIQRAMSIFHPPRV